MALLTRLAVQGPEKFQMESVRVLSGTKLTPKATVEIRIDGKKKKATETGDGPVDAVFQAIRKITKFKGVLAKFTINALTGGTDAVGEVMVAIEEKGKTVRGVGSHTDIVVASARALIAALNRLESFRPETRTEKGI